MPSRVHVLNRARGFSLLEVMVAVAILGLSLTVILSAQVGLFSSGTYAQHMSESLGLARCRMSELEEQFLKYGYPLADTTDDGSCCNGDTRQDMRCAWRIERVILPIPPMPGGLDGGAPPMGSTGLNLGTPSSISSSGTMDPLSAGMGSGMGPLGALMSATGSMPGMPGMGAGGPSGTSGLSGVLAAGAMGGTGAIAPLVMGIVYPSLKPTLEESIRKVTVTVYWREGLAKREVEIVQWVTNPVNGAAIAAAMGSGSAGTMMGGGPMGGGLTPMGGGITPMGGGITPMGGGITPMGGGIGR